MHWVFLQYNNAAKKFIFTFLLHLIACIAGHERIFYSKYANNPYVPLAPGDDCGIKVDREIREEFIQSHNYHRSRVARGLYNTKNGSLPTAANMISLRWSCDLEKAAQKWADACLWRHDRPLPLHSESLWRVWGSEEYLQRFRIGVNSTYRWSKEFEDIGTSANFHKIGHAMLMTYADQFLLGCGYARCKGATVTHLYVVCRYFSNGKRHGSGMYEDGEPGSHCPSGYRPNNRTALCEADDFPLPRQTAPFADEAHDDAISILDERNVLFSEE